MSGRIRRLTNAALDRVIVFLDGIDPNAEITPRWLWVFAIGGLLAGVLLTSSLRPSRCADTWTYAVPLSSGSCPVGAYVAEHPEAESGALVVCRCRPEPRTYEPESRP